jgi:hypothetical protein
VLDQSRMLFVVQSIEGFRIDGYCSAQAIIFRYRLHALVRAAKQEYRIAIVGKVPSDRFDYGGRGAN